MTYRLKLKSSLGKNVHRVSSGQLEIGINALTEPGGDRAVAIHSTRKALKRLRALLQLVKSGVPGDDWAAANAQLKKIARSLSAMRDRDVMRKTINTLHTTATPPLAAALEKLEAEILPAEPPSPASDTDSADDGSPDDSVSEHTRGKLAALNKQLAKLSVSGRTQDILFDGLVRVHKAGRRALREVKLNPNGEAYHDLRKAVQLHWRQMQLVRRVWPAIIDGRIAAAQEISQLIGDDHDLAVLAQRLQGATSLDADEVALIVDCVHKAQGDLRRRALPAAKRLFNARPRRFAREIMEYWAITVSPEKGEVVPDEFAAAQQPNGSAKELVQDALPAPSKPSSRRRPSRSRRKIATAPSDAAAPVREASGSGGA